jgi:von Willebrand factor A domain-containing protein 8
MHMLHLSISYLKVSNCPAHPVPPSPAFTDLSAKEEERVWIKRQTDGELDDTRLTEGLTGESTVYKRRGNEKPELGRPQVKSVRPHHSDQSLMCLISDPSV